MSLIDSETAQQLDEQNRLKAAHKKRLFVLQEKAAHLGINTPAEIRTEIEQIEQQVIAIETTITKLYIASARQAERNLIGETLFGDDHSNSTDNRISALGRYIMQVEDSLRNEIAGVYIIFDRWRSTDNDERIRRQKRLDYTLYAIILLIIILIVISIWR